MAIAPKNTKKTVAKKVTKKVTATKTKVIAVKRPHFAIRAISNRNPKGFRAHKAGKALSRFFSF